MNKLDPNGNWAFLGALYGAIFGGGTSTGAAVGFAGTVAVAELTSDASDRRIDGNGLIGSTLRRVFEPFSDQPERDQSGRSTLALAVDITARLALGQVASMADPARGQGLLDRYRATEFTGTGTHGNNLQSPNENVLYHLNDRVTGEITKIEITSDLNGGRYSQAQLDQWNSDYSPQEAYSNRLAARTAEVIQTLDFVAEHGRFPTYTFRW